MGVLRERSDDQIGRSACSYTSWIVRLPTRVSERQLIHGNSQLACLTRLHDQITNRENVHAAHSFNDYKGPHPRLEKTTQTTRNFFQNILIP